MEYKNLLTKLENGIFTIKINRPDKLNALNHETVADINDAFDEAYSNESIRAVIITGSDEKAFVAGADINEFLGITAENGEALSKKGQDVFFKIENCPKPVVAAVNGFALGGGCELAMACHMRIASENAMFGQPEVNLGLLPGYGGTQRLPQLIGKAKALELMMTAEMIDSETALSLGLVNYVTSKVELIEKCEALLKTILTKAPVAITQVIESVNAHYENKDGYAQEIASFGKCAETEDIKEGASAFIEKRKANFKGK